MTGKPDAIGARMEATSRPRIQKNWRPMPQAARRERFGSPCAHARNPVVDVAVESSDLTLDRTKVPVDLLVGACQVGHPDFESIRHHPGSPNPSYHRLIG